MAERDLADEPELGRVASAVVRVAEVAARVVDAVVPAPQQQGTSQDGTPPAQR